MWEVREDLNGMAWPAAVLGLGKEEVLDNFAGFAF